MSHLRLKGSSQPAKSCAVSPSETRLQLTERRQRSSAVNAAPSLPHCGVRGHCVTRRGDRGIRRELKPSPLSGVKKSPSLFGIYRLGRIPLRGNQIFCSFAVPRRGNGTQTRCFVVFGFVFFFHVAPCHVPQRYRQRFPTAYMRLPIRTQPLPSRRAGRGRPPARQTRGGSRWHHRAQMPTPPRRRAPS